MKLQTALADDQCQAHLDRLVNAIDLPIGRWSTEGRLLFCNDPYVRWAGRSRAELVGHRMVDLFGDSAWAAARNAFAAAFAGRTVSYERRITHRDAIARWTRVQVFPDRNGSGAVDAVYTIAFDIHDDVLQREQMEATQKRLDRFTENIPYPLTYVDRDFLLRFVNKAYMEATGHRADQLIGRHIGEVRGSRRWAEHKPYFERALNGETVQYTRLTELADRGTRWMRTSYVPDLDSHGDVVGLYTVTIDVHELTVTQERLKRSAERDPLTDTFTRRSMMDRIDGAVLHAAATPVALFFVDIDGFKGVNDGLGHPAGDRLLVSVAQALQQAVRAEDAVGRFGGDEFLVLAPVRDAAGGHVLAQHLLQAVRDCGALPLDGIGAAPPVSASIGYAIAPTDADQPLRLLQLADDAMYTAKRAGKNRVMHCDPTARR
jgi:diguanylate cyclase (GGDEF)-like protein/PAS domain S-box-containing protein